MRARPLLLALVWAIIPAMAGAQALLPSGRGFSAAGSVTVSRSSSEGSGLDGDAARVGGMVEVAYGATARLALLGALNWRTAEAETVTGAKTYTVNGVDLGLRYLGHAGRRLRPFAEGGLAVRTLRYESRFELTSRNVGPWAGVGLMHLGARHWSGEAAVTWAQSTFDNWRADGEAAVAEAASWNAIGLRAGVRYWVRAR